MDRKDFFIVRSPLPLNIRQFKGIDGFVSHTWSETATGIIVDEKNYCVESTLGFDVGVFHADGYCYSSIYQEILNPNVNIFQQFYNQLNENLLFPDYYAASLDFAKESIGDVTVLVGPGGIRDSSTFSRVEFSELLNNKNVDSINFVYIE